MLAAGSLTAASCGRTARARSKDLKCQCNSAVQESSSEAVNSYYGVYLLGVARGDDALADWGRLLLAVELRGAKKYWHIKPTGPQIYSKPFAANGVVGVLWSTQVGARCIATGTSCSSVPIHAVSHVVTSSLPPADIALSLIAA